jgi:LysR family transcriptional regulator, hydrogen peroxide-inducible genes activator
MEMHQIRYFLAVAEELNFTRAAERCTVAQPSLTRAIKLLEEELGGRLFHRERARTHLSELGHMVHPYLMHVFEQTQSVKQQAMNFTRLERTVLKLGAMCTVSPTHLVGLISALQSRYQGIELQLSDASASELQERLIDGELEVALYCLGGGQQDDRLHYMGLFREQFMIVVHPNHRLASQSAIRVKDLDGERYLNRANCELYDYAGTIWHEQGAFCKMVYRSERDDWILAMIAAGLGFGFMPEYSVNHLGVVARPVVDPEFWREVNLVTVRGRPHSPAVGAFVREAMRTQWLGQPAIAVRKASNQVKASGGAEAVDDAD